MEVFDWVTARMAVQFTGLIEWQPGWLSSLLVWLRSNSRNSIVPYDSKRNWSWMMHRLSSPYKHPPLTKQNLLSTRHLLNTKWLVSLDPETARSGRAVMISLLVRAVFAMHWKIFCIEKAGIGFRPQNVKKYEINMKKYENNMNVGPESV